MRAHGAEALRWILLCQSGEDELVEREQGLEMEKRLRGDGWVGPGDTAIGERIVERRHIVGKHDHVWEDGIQMASLIEDVVGTLVSDI